MNSLNKTGKIRAVIFLILAMVNIVFPVPPTNFTTPFIIIGALIGVPILTVVNSYLSIIPIPKKPKMPVWNDGLSFKNYLSLVHYAASFFIAIGVSIIIGTAIKFGGFADFALFSIATGVGLYLGIIILVKMKNR